jgi:hypothetical protein
MTLKVVKYVLVWKNHCRFQYIGGLYRYICDRKCRICILVGLARIYTYPIQYIGTHSST